jgi:hypothetical protein
MPRQSHFSRFYYPNNICWWIHVVKLIKTDSIIAF